MISSQDLGNWSFTKSNFLCCVLFLIMIIPYTGQNNPQVILRKYIADRGQIHIILFLRHMSIWLFLWNNWADFKRILFWNLLPPKSQTFSDIPWGIPQCATRGWHCSYGSVSQKFWHLDTTPPYPISTLPRYLKQQRNTPADITSHCISRKTAIYTCVHLELLKNRQLLWDEW